MFKRLIGKPIAFVVQTVGALGVVSLVTATPALAVQQVTQDFQMPAALLTEIEAFDCENSPGPQITFQGSMSLGGVNVRLIFRNNINKDVHTLEEDIHHVVGVEVGEEIVIPKQPSYPFDGGEGTGVGGNPWISLQLVDGNGEALTGEHLLGRCVQGVFDSDVNFLIDSTALGIIEVLDCNNNPGPYINVSGSLSMQQGVKARIIFRNQREDGAPHEAIAMTEVTLLPGGFTLEFPKQPVLGGVGGNPWISVQFADVTGPVGNETLLGRCVQLHPGN